MNELLALQRKLGHPVGARPGVNGFPTLDSSELIYPKNVTICESDTTFDILTVSRPSRIFVPGTRRNFRAIPGIMKHTGAQHIARGLFVPSLNGVLDLPAPGDWYVNAKIVTAEGTLFEAVHQDIAFPIIDAETDDSWSSKFDPRTLLAPQVNADVDAASEVLVAARVGRRYLYIRNTSTGGQVISLGFGNAAENGKGIVLKPDEWIAFDALDGVTEQAVNVISDLANATVAYQEGI